MNIPEIKDLLEMRRKCEEKLEADTLSHQNKIIETEFSKYVGESDEIKVNIGPSPIAKILEQTLHTKGYYVTQCKGADDTYTVTIYIRHVVGPYAYCKH